MQEKFLSGLTITKELPEQLIKDFHSSIRNICGRVSNCDFIDKANRKPEEVWGDSSHLSG